MKQGESRSGDQQEQPLLCVLSCEDEACHEQVLRLAARVARGLGWPLRAGVAVDENLARTAALPWLMRTGLESGRRRSFDSDDLHGYLQSVRRRLRQRVEQMAEFERADEVLEGVVDVGEGVPGALVWWRVHHRLTLLLRGGEVVAGRGAVLLALRPVSTEERRLVERAAAPFGEAGVVEPGISLAESDGPGLPDPEAVRAGLPRGFVPGVLVVALPEEVGAEVAAWIDGLSRRLGGVHVLVLR